MNENFLIISNLFILVFSFLVPEICSDMFRYTIESFFITYAETQLNTIGNVLNQDQHGHHYPLNNPWLIRGDEWCQGLLRRPQPKPKSSNPSAI